MAVYRFTEDMRETYPELIGREFTWPQMKEVYRDLVDKEEYPNFPDWMTDMRKTDLVRQMHKFPVITKDVQEEYEWHCEWNKIPITDGDIPEICGYKGRACRQMGKEANTAICFHCTLAQWAGRMQGR